MVGRRRTCKGGCGRTLYTLTARCWECQPIWVAAKKVRLEARAEKRQLGENSGLSAIRREFPAHLDWIKALPCCVPDCPVREGCDPAHVRDRTGGGTGYKPPDWWVVPLCHTHHLEQHKIMHRAFDARYGICLRDLAKDYARLSPHLTDAMKGLDLI